MALEIKLNDRNGDVAAVLKYSAQNRKLSQARFADREVFAPEIDLKSYSCIAVVDWILLEVSLSKPTQFHHLQKLLLGAVPKRCWVEASDKAPGGVSSKFRVKVQEPRLKPLEDALSAIEGVYGFAEPVKISEMEISIDFRPKNMADDDRQKMVGVLFRHFDPSVGNLLSSMTGRPRFAWGPGKAMAFLFHHDPKAPEKTLRDFPTEPDRDNAPFVDSTMYVGGKDEALMWRVMDKIVDQQNVSAGTFTVLPKKERRARIEITMKADELEKLGLKEITDLTGFKFEKLSEHFRFSLPTFSTKLGFKQWWEKLRRQKFSSTGVMGLTTFDEARWLQKKLVRAAIFKAGHKLKRLERSGQGEQGTLVGYADLNKKVFAALSRLTMRWKG